MRQDGLDSLDEQILWELVRDARTPNNVLARRFRVAPSTIVNRIRGLRERGALRATHARVDLRQLGLSLQAMISVTLQPSERGSAPRHIARIRALPQVVNIFHLGGSADLLVHVACVDTDQLRDVGAGIVRAVSQVAAVRTDVVFEHVSGADHLDHISGYDEVRAPLSAG